MCVHTLATYPTCSEGKRFHYKKKKKETCCKEERDKILHGGTLEYLIKMQTTITASSLCFHKNLFDIYLCVPEDWWWLHHAVEILFLQQECPGLRS